MYGQSNSSMCYSSNAVVSGDGAMARRKGVMTTRVVVALVVVVLIGILMGGRIFLTNQITGFRTRVADLENRKEFLEAGSAKLHMKWNLASSGEVIMSRARKELGLVVPTEPGLVLVCMSSPEKNKKGWQELWGHLAAKSDAGEMMAGAMVSLVPRGARAAAFEDGGQ